MLLRHVSVNIHTEQIEILSPERKIEMKALYKMFSVGK